MQPAILGMSEIDTATVEYMVSSAAQFYPKDNDNTYHNIGHIKRMLSLFFKHRDAISGKLSDNAVDWLNNLLNAIIFHDACYCITDVCPEVEACAVYKRAVTTPRQEVIRLIMSTSDSLGMQHPTDYWESVCVDILHDLDWEYFSDLGAFKTAETRVINELVGAGELDPVAATDKRYQFYYEIYDKMVHFNKPLYRTDILDTKTEDGTKISANKKAVLNIRAALSCKSGYLVKSAQELERMF